MAGNNNANNAKEGAQGVTSEPHPKDDLPDVSRPDHGSAASC